MANEYEPKQSASPLEKARASAETAREKASETLDSARARATEAYGSARERAADAYDTARENAAKAGKKAQEGVDANPLAAVFGGLALGALVAALLPRTKGESEAFGKVGKRVNDAAKDAAGKARAKGADALDQVRAKLDEVTETLR